MTTSIESLMKNSSGKFLKQDELSQIQNDLMFLVQENKKLNELVDHLQKEKSQFVPPAPTLQIPVQNTSHIPISLSTPNQNPLHQNPLQQNSLQQNSLQQNSLQQNPLQQNSLQQNSLQQNPLQQNSLLLSNKLPDLIQELPDSMPIVEKQNNNPIYKTPITHTVTHTPSLSVPEDTRSITIIIDTNKMIYLLLFIILMIIILKK